MRMMCPAQGCTRSCSVVHSACASVPSSAHSSSHSKPSSTDALLTAGSPAVTVSGTAKLRPVQGHNPAQAASCLRL